MVVADKGIGETTIDYRVEDGDEDGNDAYQSILMWSEESSQHQANKERDALSHQAVSKAPTYTTDSLLPEGG